MRTFLYVLVLVTLYCYGSRAGLKGKPYPSGSEIAVNAESWSLYQRTETPTPVTNLLNGGIYFDFPVSPLPDPLATPPWDGYLLTSLWQLKAGTQIGTDLRGTHLVFVFQVLATPNVLWNYMSDPDNTAPVSPKMTLYFGRFNPMYNAWDGSRWWASAYRWTLSDSGGVLTLDVPIDPAYWSDTYGHPATLDDMHRLNFCGTPGILRNVFYLGVTFGGGSAYGHGVNVSSADGQAAQAQFRLLRVYTY